MPDHDEALGKYYWNHQRDCGGSNVMPDRDEAWGKYHFYPYYPIANC